MAYKILGQSKPSATSETTLYTVPAAKSAVVSTITVGNVTWSSLPDAYRIYIIPSGGGSGTDGTALCKDFTIVGKDMIAFTLWITLATWDKINVYSSSGYCTFMAFGNEI